MAQENPGVGTGTRIVRKVSFFVFYPDLAISHSVTLLKVRQSTSYSTRLVSDLNIAGFALRRAMEFSFDRCNNSGRASAEKRSTSFSVPHRSFRRPLSEPSRACPTQQRRRGQCARGLDESCTMRNANHERKRKLGKKTVSCSSSFEMHSTPNRIYTFVHYERMERLSIYKVVWKCRHYAH